MATSSDWRAYQAEAAHFFRSLGLEADVEARIRGARSAHVVDVLVSVRTGGVIQLWIVECKAWNRPVPKETVLTLKGVLEDTGADRGFLLSQNGHQPGAVSAARFANITLSRLEDLYENARADLETVRLDRLGMCLRRTEVRLMNLPKEAWSHFDERERLTNGLASVEELMGDARLGLFPFMREHQHRDAPDVASAVDLAAFLSASEALVTRANEWRDKYGPSAADVVEHLAGTNAFRDALMRRMTEVVTSTPWRLAADRILDISAMGVPEVSGIYTVDGVALTGFSVICRMAVQDSDTADGVRECFACVDLDVGVLIPSGHIKYAKIDALQTASEDQWTKAQTQIRHYTNDPAEG